MTRRAPAFWWRARPSVSARALWPVSRVWSAAALWRMKQPASFRPPVPVVCVGNFVVGGAGKTPTAIALARMVRGKGLRPGLLAYGYGAPARKPVLVDPAAHGADTVGDEGLLLAAAGPTVVCSDRAAGARRLCEEPIDVMIMDDGFQNPAIARDLSIVVVDAAIGLGNGLAVPAGPLRAPLKPQMQRADALLVIGEGVAADPVIRAAARAGRKVLRARLKPTHVKDWRKDPILAFAGIGHPEKFFATLDATNAPVAKTLSFPDHYAYSEVDAEKLLQLADADNLRIVTTDKDIVRLAGKGGALGRLRERAEPFHVLLEFENPRIVSDMLDETIREAALAHAK